MFKIGDIICNGRNHYRIIERSGEEYGTFTVKHILDRGKPCDGYFFLRVGPAPYLWVDYYLTFMERYFNETA